MDTNEWTTGKIVLVSTLPIVSTALVICFIYGFKRFVDRRYLLTSPNLVTSTDFLYKMATAPSRPRPRPLLYSGRQISGVRTRPGGTTGACVPAPPSHHAICPGPSAEGE